MSVLSLAVRNELAKRQSLRLLLAKNKDWDTWIFDVRPVKAAIEGTSLAMIIVSQSDPYTGANEHNTMRFPRLLVDVWADPTRNADGSVQIPDADAKINAIFKEVDPVLHLVDRALGGSLMIWGTQEQVDTKTGVFVAGAHRISGDIDYSDVKDSEGTRMGRVAYGVNML